MNRPEVPEPSDWDDFEVPGGEEPIPPSEIVARFREFKKALADIPKRELRDRGWLGEGGSMEPIQRLLSQYLASDARSLFRRSSFSPSSLDILWLAKTKDEAKRTLIKKPIPSFEGLTREDLRELALRSVDPAFIGSLTEVLGRRGIVLILVPALSGLKVDGVVYRLPSGNPAIGMSIRYPRLDYFWFTLMHELSHIVLHGDLIGEAIVDSLDEEDTSVVETQANRLAKESFVPRHLWRQAAPKYEKSPASVLAFAKSVGIHPSIVAGMLRKEEGNYERYSKLVNEINTRSILFPEL